MGGKVTGNIDVVASSDVQGLGVGVSLAVRQVQYAIAYRP